MAVFQWKGVIQFGPFINVPVAAKAAVKTDTVKFNMVHTDCGAKAGYSQKWGCDAGHEIERSDTQKAFNGHVVDEAYVKSLKAERAATITLVSLVDASEIDPRYYEASYDVTPQEGGEKSYVLFATLLAKSGKVGIFTAVLSDREQLVAIRPRDGILAMETMYFPEDLTRAGRDEAAREAIKDVEVTDAEMAMGEQLIAMLSGHFDPAAHTDHYTARLKEYLKTLEDGTAAPVVSAAPAAPAAIDLMAALTASIEASKVAVPVEKKSKKKVAV